MPGITFNDSYDIFWCACAKGSKAGFKTGGSSGNVKKHRLRGGGTYDQQQSRIGDKPKKKLVTQNEFRKVLPSTVVSCNLSFSVVSNPQFQKLLTVGSGRTDLKAPSRNTTVGDLNRMKHFVTKEMERSISNLISKFSITFDLREDFLP